MSLCPYDSRIYGGLFGDEEMARILSDEAALGAMLRFERALAEVQARRGLIPEAAARRIADALDSLAIEPESLRQPTVSAGLPVPALVAALRQAVGEPHGDFVHRGATSQDVLDTALVLMLREALQVLEGRLDRLIASLATAARQHARTVMAARTRSQLATPTTLGLRIAGWVGPLARCRQRLEQLRPRLLVVQLGGASGTQAALEPEGPALMMDLAAELGLGAPAKPWHAERDAIAELGGWLSLVSGACGRIGADLVLLGRSEIGELQAGAGGGSSTMPQKANPVLAEALVTLARQNAAQLSTLHQALVHTEERDGAAWALEWLALPQMLAATAAALAHAAALAADLRPDPGRMRATLDASGGAVLAETYAFALSEHMPLPQAQALVKRAVATGRPLAEALREISAAPVDWDRMQQFDRQVGAAVELIERALAEADHPQDTT